MDHQRSFQITEEKRDNYRDSFEKSKDAFNICEIQPGSVDSARWEVRDWISTFFLQFYFCDLSDSSELETTLYRRSVNAFHREQLSIAENEGKKGRTHHEYANT